uniref:Choline transporter-like protein n=3 Tax=Ixodes ricinus TaxID=34613 RepID=A0A147BCM5_IXORI
MGLCCQRSGDEATPVPERRDRRAPTAFKPRGCTDLPCFVVFMAFWGTAIFVSAFAFVLGNPFRLISGYDSFGNVCGMNNDEPMGALQFSGQNMTGRPYLFYFDLSNLSHSLKVCVKQCPHRELKTTEQVRRFGEETGSSLCRYDVTEPGRSSSLFPDLSMLSNQTVVDMFNKEQQKRGFGPCPRLPVPASKPVLNRCVPEAVVDLTQDFFHSIYSYLNSIDALQQVVSDLYAAWREVAGMILFACVVALVAVFLVHLLAKLVSLIILVSTAVALMAITAVLWWTYVDIKLGLDSTPFGQLLEEAAMNEHAFLVFAIVSTVIMVIILLLVVAMWKRVALVAALFKEASLCIRHMPFLLAQPVWTFLALATLFLFWTLVLLFLATADYPTRETRQFLPFVPSNLTSPSNLTELLEPQPAAETRMFTLVAYDQRSWVHYMWWFHIVFLVWMGEFILACQQMVIAGAVASWYFCKDRSSLSNPIGRSVARLVLYHLGSVAMGSFLILVFKLPRIVLSVLQRWLNKHGDQTCCSCALRGCRCCFWCLEKFLCYLNHNAYTVVAIKGRSFCGSARIAFFTIAENAFSVATVNSVGDFVLFLAKCLVTALTGLVGVLLLKNNPELHLYAIPALVMCVFAFFVAHCVLSLYEMVIDTLLLCFCEDLAAHRSNPEHEFYAPEGLRQFFLADSSDAALQSLAKA